MGFEWRVGAAFERDLERAHGDISSHGDMSPVTERRDEEPRRRKKALPGRSKDRLERTGSGGSRIIFAGDAQFAEARVQRGAIHAELFGGASGTGDFSSRAAQNLEDVLALDVFERR